MARVKYIDDTTNPALAEVAGKLRAGRRGRLLNLYKLLLHSPSLASTWYEHIGAARWQTELDGGTRELAIIRIGILNRVEYVLRQHVPQYALEEGLTIEQCEALAEWQSNESLFNDRERAVLAYTDAMTLTIEVPDRVFEALRPHFSERQIVELSVLIGTYNMHTRVLTALRIDLEAREGD